MNAEQAATGRTYKTSDGKKVTVVEKRPGQVLVRLDSGDMVMLPNSYTLNEVNTMPDTPVIPKPVQTATESTPITEEQALTAPKATKVKKLKKSNVVDEGLAGNLTAAQIVANVLEKFPEATEKSIKNLISVRRSRLKKSQG